MNQPLDLTRRQFFRRVLGWGIGALALYPLLRFFSPDIGRKSQNISHHPADWYKRLAG
jgi:hypothetical protein